MNQAAVKIRSLAAKGRQLLKLLTWLVESLEKFPFIGSNGKEE